MLVLNNHIFHQQIHKLQRILEVVLRKILINPTILDFKLSKIQFNQLSGIETKRALQDKSIHLYIVIHKSNEL